MTYGVFFMFFLGLFLARARPRHIAQGL